MSGVLGKLEPLKAHFHTSKYRIVQWKWMWICSNRSGKSKKDLEEKQLKVSSYYSINSKGLMQPLSREQLLQARRFSGCMWCWWDWHKNNAVSSCIHFWIAFSLKKKKRKGKKEKLQKNLYIFRHLEKMPCSKKCNIFICLGCQKEDCRVTWWSKKEVFWGGRENISTRRPSN